jgi:hypothetical protein
MAEFFDLDLYAIVGETGAKAIVARYFAGDADAWGRPVNDRPWRTG